MTTTDRQRELNRQRQARFRARRRQARLADHSRPPRIRRNLSGYTPEERLNRRRWQNRLRQQRLRQRTAAAKKPAARAGARVDAAAAYQKPKQRGHRLPLSTATRATHGVEEKKGDGFSPQNPSKNAGPARNATRHAPPPCPPAFILIRWLASLGLRPRVRFGFLKYVGTLRITIFDWAKALVGWLRRRKTVRRRPSCRRGRPLNPHHDLRRRERLDGTLRPAGYSKWPHWEPWVRERLRPEEVRRGRPNAWQLLLQSLGLTPPRPAPPRPAPAQPSHEPPGPPMPERLGRPPLPPGATLRDFLGMKTSLATTGAAG